MTDAEVRAGVVKGEGEGQSARLFFPCPEVLASLSAAIFLRENRIFSPPKLESRDVFAGTSKPRPGKGVAIRFIFDFLRKSLP
jgi:hypothetical protein